MKNLVGIFKKNYVIALFITIIFFAFFLTLFSPIYETNDDVIFTLIANGYYTKSPSPYFQINPQFQTFHILLSVFLVQLYIKWPDINWYSVLMFISAALSFYGIILLILKKITHKYLMTLCIIGLSFFYSRILMFLSFTTIATITGVAGIALFFSYQQSRTENNHVAMALAFLLLTLSQLIRQAPIFLIIVILTPFFFLSQSIKTKSLIVFLFIIIFSFLLLKYINISAYKSNPAWKKSMSFLLPLGQFFYGYRFYNYDNNKNVYTRNGWSKNDYKMIESFFYEDTQTYSTNKIHNIVKDIPLNSVHIKLLTEALLQFKIVLFNVGDITILYICTTVALWSQYKFRQKIILILAISIGFMISIYFLYLGHFPSRNIISIFFALYILNILLLNVSNQITIPFRKVRVLSVAILLISVYIALGDLYMKINTINKNKSKYFKQMISYIPEENNSLTLAWASALPYEWEYVFSNFSDLKNKNILIGSWTQRSPINEEIKKRFNITNVYFDLIENKNFYLLVFDYGRPLLKTYMKEHYGVVIDYVTIKNFKTLNYPSQLVKVKKVNK